MTAPSGELLIVLSEALGVADRRGDNTTNMAHAQLVRLVALAEELVAHADVIVPLLQPYVTEQPKLVDLVGLGVPESQREPVLERATVNGSRYVPADYVRPKS